MHKYAIKFDGDWYTVLRKDEFGIAPMGSHLALEDALRWICMRTGQPVVLDILTTAE